MAVRSTDERVTLVTIDDGPADLDKIEDVYVDDVDGEAPEEESPTAEQALRYYGVDFDVEGIVRRFDRNDLVVPSFDPAGDSSDPYAGFQRRFVWTKKQMDRFVESILLGYPVPGIFLVEQTNRRFLILDGQQRIGTLHAFFKGRYMTPRSGQKLFRLENVGKNFRGLTYETLPEPDRRLFDSTILQSTVVVPSGADLDPVYRVFERINSGGTKLTVQEIRVALYSGNLIRLVRDLNSTADWRAMFGEPHSRLKDHELVLRYLALLENLTTIEQYDWDRSAARADPIDGPKVYKPAMATYLNSYLGRHRNLEGLDSEQISYEFQKVTSVLREGMGPAAVRLSSTQVNAALTDAVMVGCALAIRMGAPVTPASAKESVTTLKESKSFLDEILDSTSHAENVQNRLRIAYEQFVLDA